MGGLCLMLGACGGEDSDSDTANDSSAEGDTNANDDDGPSGNDDGDNNNGDDGDDSSQQTQQESECSDSSQCEFVVCDCAEGPVNFQGCSVVNGIGTCATEDTCASSACD